MFFHFENSSCFTGLFPPYKFALNFTILFGFSFMDIQKQIEIIRRGTVDLISEEELKSKLQKK
ncbi:hypothetical protein LEP1GSC127_0059, partial [Leptospira kirschneri str. 200801925]